jgi:hypothetical protein
MAAAAQGYDTICATYEINEGRKTVIFHVQVALVPNDVGTDLVLTNEFFRQSTERDRRIEAGFQVLDGHVRACGTDKVIRSLAQHLDP